jgi:D-sedoheptulose 7-phosphate isomerase
MEFLTERIMASTQVSLNWLSNSDELEAFEDFCNQVKLRLHEGNTLYIFGNGGSAAEASHIAAEFVGKCVTPSRALSSISLNDSISGITAIGNDWDFEMVFSRQLEAHAKPSDIVIGLSTSGNSRNVIAGLKKGKEIGCLTSLWTSTLFYTTNLAFDYVFRAPSSSTPRTQELHLQWGHVLAEYVEISEIR